MGEISSTIFAEQTHHFGTAGELLWFILGTWFTTPLYGSMVSSQKDILGGVIFLKTLDDSIESD